MFELSWRGEGNEGKGGALSAAILVPTSSLFLSAGETTGTGWRDCPPPICHFFAGGEAAREELEKAALE